VETVTVLAVGFDDGAERSLLGFAASEENPDDVLVLARDHRVGPSDAALGMDTYCIITGTSGATHYGGIDTAEWPAPDRLRLCLNADAAETLMLPREFELLLPDVTTADEVRARLPSLLA
jgi:hypothetical protein